MCVIKFMSRFRGPRLRIVRRIGILPGLTKKVCKKKMFPGPGLVSSTKKSSLYNVRLKEKQKLRFNYGINERQLLNYVKLSRSKKGSSGRILLGLLEMRLDNIVFRIGFASTIYAARQLVNHGHITVDSRIVNIPSFICRPNILLKVKTSPGSIILVKNNLQRFGNSVIPQHLLVNAAALEAKVISYINRKSLSLLINELLVIEYYSRQL